MEHISGLVVYRKYAKLNTYLVFSYLAQIKSNNTYN
jgi:hypothetical protein